MKHQTQLPKYRLSLPWTLLAAVLLAGAITLLALWCQPNRLRDVVAIFLQKPILILLNAMPVGLFLLTLTCLFRNVFFSASLVNLLVCGLSIANRIKIEVRDEPVFPRDLALLKEVGSAMSSYEIHLPVTLIVTVVIFSLLLLLAGLAVDCKPLPLGRLPDWLGRVLSTLVCFGVLVVFIVTAVGSSDLYRSIGASNPYRVSTVFNETGFPYSFCHQFTTYLVDKPEGFSAAEAEGWDTQAMDATQSNLPVNVVFVMNEAFSDVTDHPALSYPEGQNPLNNLHALRQDPHAYVGHLVVPGFAGGTANTEFDVLTGMQTNALSATTTSAFRVVNRNLDSLFRVFEADDYRTSFFHPGESWFYNRQNVYRWLGAGETRFVDSMKSPDTKGTWISDDYAASMIEAEFESSLQAGKPLFHYTTTIQNHMAYVPEKYGDDFPYPPVTSSLPLSADAQSMLAVYAEGARDADHMLGRLVDYFRRQEAPVVLVFYGDHLPYLGDNQLTYAELGMTEDPLWEDQISYRTPLVLWCNDAAAELLHWENALEQLDLPEDGNLSACFLGAAVLELTGRGDDIPWFHFLNQLRRTAPVIQKQLYVLADGTWTKEPEEELAQTIDQWRKWSYYKLQEKEIPNTPASP